MLDDVELNRLLEEISAPEALAGEDYGEGWIPDRGKGGDHADLSTDARDVTGRTGDEWRNAGTAAAIDAQRAREKRLEEAKDEETREMIRRDSSRDFFRLSLIFSGEEGQIVKRVLGGAPAEALVDLCRREAGELERQLGEGWVTIESVVGQRTIPGGVAQVLKDALDRMEMSGDLGSKNRFQGLEYLAAEYMSGSEPKKEEEWPGVGSTRSVKLGRMS